MKSAVLVDCFHSGEYEPQNNNSAGYCKEQPAGESNNFHSCLILEQRYPNSPFPLSFIGNITLLSHLFLSALPPVSLSSPFLPSSPFFFPVMSMICQNHSEHADHSFVFPLCSINRIITHSQAILCFQQFSPVCQILPPFFAVLAEARIVYSLLLISVIDPPPHDTYASQRGFRVLGSKGTDRNAIEYTRVTPSQEWSCRCS